MKHLAEYPNAEVLWNHKVVAIDDHEDSVTAVCETPNGKVEITAQYLVGSDGARSTVRKLIGCTFDGFTYDKMVVATNVYYPFREHGFSVAQFILDPQHFALVRSLSLKLIIRSANVRLMGCSAALTEKMRLLHLNKPAPTSITNTIKCFLVQNLLNTM